MTAVNIKEGVPKHPFTMVLERPGRKKLSGELADL